MAILLCSGQTFGTIFYRISLQGFTRLPKIKQSQSSYFCKITSLINNFTFLSQYKLFKNTKSCNSSFSNYKSLLKPGIHGPTSGETQLIRHLNSTIYLTSIFNLQELIYGFGTSSAATSSKYLSGSY
jgi:hypothetical protein